MELNVGIGNVQLKNPLILASASYSVSERGLEKYIRKGFGAVITKTTTIKPLKGSPLPRIFWYDPDRKLMLSGAEAVRNPGMERMYRSIAAVKKLAESENCLIVGSLAGNTAEEMNHIAKRFVEAGADIIEMNMVCSATGPHLGPDYERLGSYWSQTPERAVEAIQGVKSTVSVPVWAKCSLSSMIKEEFINKVDKEARPDAYSFIGGKIPCLVIDVETGKPKFPGNVLLQIKKKIPICPMSHGPVKASTILHTAYIARLTDTPLIPSGGFYKGEDIVEAIMVGSSAAQICTAIYRNNNAANVFLKDIEAFMQRRNIESLGKLRGTSLQYIPAPPLLKAHIFS
ncbi:MAG: tRNA-dihydrouridine synthase [Deltaproteobacteria bacterium]|nr:tRNA-dihydrouridine synthase [Deltaproteobacteria bacterium]MBW2305401.1 tRNA-dihydrouridine synthase [Deltaproteobacteria bacterium]